MWKTKILNEEINKTFCCATKNNKSVFINHPKIIRYETSLRTYTSRLYAYSGINALLYCASFVKICEQFLLSLAHNIKLLISFASHRNKELNDFSSLYGAQAKHWLWITLWLPLNFIKFALDKDIRKHFFWERWNLSVAFQRDKKNLRNCIVIANEDEIFFINVHRCDNNFSHAYLVSKVFTS